MPRANYLPLFMTQKTAGQDSNDIFDIQARIRQSQSHTDVTDYNRQKEHKGHRRISEFEDVKRTDDANISSACRRSLSEGKIQQDPSTKRSPPVAVGKENVGTHFKVCLSPRISVKNAAKSVENSDAESSGDEASSDVNSMHKISTQKEADSVSQSCLGDSTNVATSSDSQKQEVLKQVKPRRPCIRVREPPGGKSSIVFH